MKTQKHEHIYALKTKKVTLAEGKAVDTLKQWVCTGEKCDKTVTFDLKRSVK